MNHALQTHDWRVNCSVVLHRQVDQWLEFAPYLVTGGGLEPACATVNEALALRTYLAGYSLSPADIAVWGQLQGEGRL